MSEQVVSGEATSSEAESTGSSAPESGQVDVTTNAGDTAPEAGSVSETPNTSAPVVPEVPAYTPNFKYKALDKEHEMPEWVRAAIKDAKTEEEARGVFAKAQGMDFYKGQRDKLRTEHQQMREQVTPIMQELQKANFHLENGDFGGFCETWGVSDEIVFKYVLDKLQYMKMDPDQKAKFDQGRQVRAQAYDVQQENARLQQQLAAVQTQALDQHIQGVLSSPEISAAAQVFDARENKPGAFREHLLEMGDFLFKQTGKLVPPDQVAQMIVRRYGLGSQTQTGAQVPAQNAAPQTKVIPNPQAKPVIPNVAGRSASVVKKQVTSIADLRKLQEEMNA